MINYLCHTNVFFLGFTRSQKGFKCFSPSLNLYFISIDLIFTESSFYLKSLSSSLVSPSNQIHIPVVFDPLVMSSVPKDSPPPPYFQVYNCHHTSYHPPDNSLLVPTPPPFPPPMV